MKQVFAALAALTTLAAAPAWATDRIATLDVPGMTCPACPITVKKALTRVVGVTAVNTVLDKREVIVHYDDSKTQPAALLQATRNAGYPSTIQPRG